jgi:hypothetical protein
MMVGRLAGRKMEAEMIRTIVKHATLSLALLAGGALLSAPSMAASSITYHLVKERVWLGPKRGYQYRYFYVGRETNLNLPPDNTPVKLKPGRPFYTVPHYKSSYGAGYHTNGPGIGIMR